MRHILFSLILVLFFSGCQDKKEDQTQHDAKIAQEARAELLKEQAEAKQKQEELEKNNRFSKIGITTEEGKIIIDTNKTKGFFKDLSHKMKIKIDKMHEDMEKGFIKHDEAGIEMDETHINIDLNKTKSFLETWGKKMQEFVKEFDDIAKEFDNQNKTTKDTDATN